MQLSEIKMSPTALIAGTSNLNVLVGIEYEFIAVGYNVDEDGTPDYSHDIPVTSIQAVREFFSTNNANHTDDIRRVTRELSSEYRDQRNIVIEEMWQMDNAYRYVLEYFIKSKFEDEIREQIKGILDKQRVDRSQFPEILKYSENAQEVIKRKPPEGLSKQERENFWTYADAWNQLEDRYTEMALEVLEDDTSREHRFAREYFSANTEGLSEAEFFEDRYPAMSDIENDFYLEWPYYRGNQGLNDLLVNIDQEIGEELSAVVDINHSPGRYRLTTDSSIAMGHSDDTPESGIELISPPLTLEQTISDFKTIKKWCRRNNHYSDQSTGLHVNISIPGKSMKELDYVKLILLLGDEYILKEFNRTANKYTQSSIDILNRKVSGRRDSDIAANALSLLKQNLNIEAARSLTWFYTDKYSSIHLHDNYVEFRGMGDDWIGISSELIITNIMRMCVVLDAAMSPTKYQREYQTKLYKFLSNYVKSTDASLIDLFAKHSAGMIETSDLKAELNKKFASKKSLKKFDTSGVKYYMFANIKEGYAWESVEEKDLANIEEMAFKQFKVYLEKVEEQHDLDDREIQDRWEIEKRHCKVYPTDENTFQQIQKDGAIGSFIYDSQRRIYRVP